MSKMQRTKGHSFEREVCKELKEIFPLAQRKLEYQTSKCNGVDLDNTGNLRIQCKRYAKYVNPSKIEEIKDSSGIPVLITKGDRKEAIACLYLKDLKRILKDIGEAWG